MAVHCSKCDAEISDADFNIATDVAYCRQCKINYKYSDLVSRVEPTRLDHSRLPKYIAVEELMDGMRIIYYRRPSIVYFMIPFACIWSGMALLIIYILPWMDGSLNLQKALFGLPFLLGSLIIWAVVVFMFFGKWTILIGKAESFVSSGVGRIQRKRPFNLGDLRTVSIKDTNESVNEKRAQAIELKFEDGSTLMFGAYIEDDSKRFIAEVMASLAAK